MGSASGPRLPGIALIPLLAIGLGVVAALLVGPAAASASWSGPDLNLGPLPHVPAIVFVWLLVLLFLAGLGSVLAQRLLGRTMAVPSRALAMGLAALVAGMILVLLFHFAAHPAPPPSSPGNTSSSTPPGNPPGSSGGPVGTSPVPAIWPWWVTVGLLVVAATAIGLIAVLATRARSRPAAPSAAPRPSPRAAIDRAIETLGRSAADDARSAILLAYAQLLEAVGSRVGPIEMLTARELVHALVDGLGIEVPAAQRLTSLFELARYSTQPLPADAPSQARTALTEARRELAVRAGAA